MTETVGKRSGDNAMFEVQTTQDLADGQVVFEEGSEGSDIYRVERGAVTVTKVVYGESLVVEVIRRGEIFGEMAILAGIPRTATATALGKTTLSVLSPGSVKDEFYSLSPGMRQVFQNLVFRLKKATETSTGVHYLRKEPRSKKIFSLSFLANDTELETYSHDASCGGLFIKTEKPLDRGREFELKLWIPNENKPLVVNCKVAWNRTRTNDPVVQPLGMGVTFIHISKEDYEKLQVVLPEC